MCSSHSLVFSLYNLHVIVRDHIHIFIFVDIPTPCRPYYPLTSKSSRAHLGMCSSTSCKSRQKTMFNVSYSILNFFIFTINRTIFASNSRNFDISALKHFIMSIFSFCVSLSRKILEHILRCARGNSGFSQETRLSKQIRWAHLKMCSQTLGRFFLLMISFTMFDSPCQHHFYLSTTTTSRDVLETPLCFLEKHDTKYKIPWAHPGMCSLNLGRFFLKLFDLWFWRTILAYLRRPHLEMCSPIFGRFFY